MAKLSMDMAFSHGWRGPAYSVEICASVTGLFLSKSPIAGKKVTNFPSKKRHVAIYKLTNHLYGDKSGNSDAKTAAEISTEYAGPHRSFAQ